MAILDGSRFLAAVAVMLFHFTSRDHPSWGESPSETFPLLSGFTAAGAFGVDLFFIISGFVILMTAWGRDMPSYVTSRITRLFPAYWAGVLLTGFLLIVLWPGRKALDLTDVGVNLTMLQTAFEIQHVDGVYWTLWVELRFYVLLGILLLIGITGARVLAFASMWPVAGALAYTAEADLLANLLIWNYAPLFAGGMALFVLTRDRRSVLAWLVLAQNVILSIAWSGLQTQALIERNSGHAISTVACAAIVITCFGLVMVGTLTRLRHLRTAWLTTAGLLTYPLYLLHEYWGWWIIDMLHDTLPRYVVLAISMAVALALAWAVHLLVEKPLAPRLKRGLIEGFARLRAMDGAPADNLTRGATRSGHPGERDGASERGGAENPAFSAVTSPKAG